MKFILILIAFATVYSSPNPDRRKRMIIDGTDADIKDYPFFARLLINVGGGLYSGCGGTLLNKRWVLTAAHCVVFHNKVVAPEAIEAYFGTPMKDPKQSLAPYTERIASKVVLHPSIPANTDWTHTMPDLALIKLQSPVELTDRIDAARMPDSSNNLQIGDKIYLVGQGAVGAMTPYVGASPDKWAYKATDRLQKATVNLAECSQSDPGQHRICTRSNTDIGVCSGDSGGPVLAKDSNGMYLVGVVSHGWPETDSSPWDLEACGHGLEDIHEDVKYYLNWIKKTMSSDPDTVPETPDQPEQPSEDNGDQDPNGPQYPDENEDKDQHENPDEIPDEYYDGNQGACKNYQQDVNCDLYHDLAHECDGQGWIRGVQCLKLCGMC